MTDVSTIESVRARLQEVEELIPKHEMMIAFLKKERENAAIALQVLENLHKRPTYLDAVKLPDELEPKAGESTKPEGTPTLPVMILEALLEAQDQGRQGLEPFELTAFVRERYWPDAPSSSVGPTAWRMMRDKRLVRVGELYALPETTSAKVGDLF